MESWKLDVSKLEDNAFQYFYLEKKIKIKNREKYYLQIREKYSDDNSVAIWIRRSENDSKIHSNIKSYEEYNLSYKEIYVNKVLELKIMVYVIVLLTIICGTSIFYRGTSTWIRMETSLIMLGILYFMICPLGMVPDKTNHFSRAFEISCGNMVSKHLGETGVGGNFLPEAIQFYKDETAVLNWNNITSISFGNTALYSPVTYLPQALGIKIIRYFTNNVSIIFYGGRLGGFVVCMILGSLALYIVPFGKNIIYLILLFPLTLQEMISLSPDGFTICLSLLFLAYILKLCYAKEKITKIDLVILTIVGGTLALCKIVYIVLLLMIFMLPSKKFETTKKSFGYKICFIIAAVGLNVIWLKISAGYMVEFNPGVDSAMQVKFVLTHMLRYALIVIRTTIMNGSFYIRTMFGSLMGAASIETNSIIWITYLILFITSICLCPMPNIKIQKNNVIILFVTFLSGCALIYTSLYVQWTPYKNDVINGIQGRYFTPIIATLAMGVVISLKNPPLTYNNKKENMFDMVYIHILAIVLNAMTVLDITAYYL